MKNYFRMLQPHLIGTPLLLFLMLWTVPQGVRAQGSEAGKWNGYYPETGDAAADLLAACSGTGTAEDPILIRTAAQFAAFCKAVNSSYSLPPLHGKEPRYLHYKLTTDIDLNPNKRVLNDDLTLTSMSGSLHEWTPIGDSYGKFSGGFDGDGHTIRGMYVKGGSSEYRGLFGQIELYNDNVYVKNLTIEDAFVEPSYRAGTVCGYAYKNSSNTLHLDMTDITVRNANVSSNNGTNAYAGGIIGLGMVDIDIRGCQFKGKVQITNGGSAGGIIGQQTSGASLFMLNCAAEASINDGNWVGGLIGYCGSSHNIHNSTFNGNIHISTFDSSSDVCVGGLIGFVYAYNSTTVIQNCTARGTITGLGTFVGGLMGKSYGGNLTNSSASYMDIDCQPKSTSSPELAVGGCVGYIYGYVSHLVNYGSVHVTFPATSSSYCCKIGGVVGYGSKTINDCANAGSVIGENSSSNICFIGGIVGELSSEDPVYNCANSGDVIAKSGVWNHGGIAGQTGQSIYNCYNTGYLENKNAGSSFGGIVGYFTHHINSCYNAGSMRFAEGTVNKGNIVGTLTPGSQGGSVNKCLYDEQICLVTDAVGNDDSKTSTPVQTSDLTGYTTSQLSSALSSQFVHVDNSPSAPSGGASPAPRKTGSTPANCYPGLNTLLSNETFDDFNSVSLVPVQLQSGQNANGVVNSFNAVSRDDVAWSSSNDRVIFNYRASEPGTYLAHIVSNGVDTATVAKEGVVRHVWLNVSSVYDCDGTTAPYTDGASTYNISNREELERFRATVNTGRNNINAVLTADIDLQEDTHLSVLDANGNLINGGSGLATWCPIGTTDYPYTGTFDGNNHTISGLYINADKSYQGLFGFIQGGTVQDLTLDDSYVNVNGNEYGGILAGNVGSWTGNWPHDAEKMSTISNVTLQKAYATGFQFVGGLVGHANDLIMTNCHNLNGRVRAGYLVGGLIGHTAYKTTISLCSNNASVEGTSADYVNPTVTTGATVGGIVGALNTLVNVQLNTAFPADGRSTLTRCFNGGRISGFNAVGGLVGQSGSDRTYSDFVLTGKNQGGLVDECFNFGTILGLANDEYNQWGGGSGFIGGVTGISTMHAIVRNSYNTGYVENDVNGDESIILGGVSGLLQSGATMTNVYNAGVVRNLKMFYYGSGIATKGSEDGYTTGFTNGYYDEQMCTMPTSSIVMATFDGTVVNLPHDANAFSTGKMTATDVSGEGMPYSGFSAETWDFTLDGQYPALKWATATDGTRAKNAALVSVSPAYLIHNYDDAFTTVDDIAIDFTTCKRNGVNWTSGNTDVLTFGTGEYADHGYAHVHPEGIPYVPCPEFYYLDNGVMRATKSDFTREVPFFLFRPIEFEDNELSEGAVAEHSVEFISQKHRLVGSNETYPTGVDPTTLNPEGILFEEGQLYNYWDWNGDGKVTTYEAAIVKDLENVYQGGDGDLSSTVANPLNGNVDDEGYHIRWFDELKFFTGLTYLNPKDFKRCTLLEKITIPRNVQHIGYETFSTSISLPEFKVDPNNASAYLMAEEGVLYTADGKTLTAFPGGKLSSQTTEGRLHWWDVPTRVNRVAQTAFSGCLRLDALFFDTPHMESDGYGLEAFKECNSILGARTNGDKKNELSGANADYEFAVYVHDGTEFGTHLNTFGGFHRFKNSMTQTNWSQYNLLRFFRENVSTYKFATLYLPYENTIPYDRKYTAYGGQQINMVGGSVGDVCYGKVLSQEGSDEGVYVMQLLSVDQDGKDIASFSDGLLQPASGAVVYSDVSEPQQYRFLEKKPLNFEGASYPTYSTQPIPEAQNLLSGVYENTPVSSLTSGDGYILTLSPEDHTGEFGFWHYLGSSVRANSCYVATEDIPWLNSGNGAAFLGFRMSFDDTTGIISPLAPVADGAWYTLDGRRLAGRPVFSGIYIHNGKKVIVKK